MNSIRKEEKLKNFPPPLALFLSMFSLSLSLSRLLFSANLRREKSFSPLISLWKYLTLTIPIWWKTPRFPRKTKKKGRTIQLFLIRFFQAENISSQKSSMSVYRLIQTNKYSRFSQERFASIRSPFMSTNNIDRHSILILPCRYQ